MYQGYVENEARIKARWELMKQRAEKIAKAKAKQQNKTPNVWMAATEE